jgi:hypothetical protein
MYPSVEGAVVEPSIFATRPRSTVTDRLQLSGQSRGHAVCTVDRPQERGGEIFGSAMAKCKPKRLLCYGERT